MFIKGCLEYYFIFRAERARVRAAVCSFT